MSFVVRKCPNQRIVKGEKVCRSGRLGAEQMKSVDQLVLMWRSIMALKRAAGSLKLQESRMLQPSQKLELMIPIGAISDNAPITNGVVNLLNRSSIKPRPFSCGSRQPHEFEENFHVNQQGDLRFFRQCSDKTQRYRIIESFVFSLSEVLDVLIHEYRAMDVHFDLPIPPFRFLRLWQ
jgi:hypothetical protein